MLFRITILLVFLLRPAWGQSGQLTLTNKGSRVEDVRMECIEQRRVICGKILKVLPDGLVIDSGYTNLMRPPFLSWLIPANVTSQRAINMVEAGEPESVCIGLVFLTDLPKKPVPKLYDYVNLVGFPRGFRKYKSVGNIQRTIRSFSTKVANAVQWNLEHSVKQNTPAK